MRGTSTNRVFSVTILLGILVTFTASENHLYSPSHAAGPPPIQNPTQIQKQVSHTRNSSVSVTRPLSNLAARALAGSRPIPMVAKKKKPTPKHPTKSGWQLLLDGQPQTAVAIYRQALRQNPQSANAYLGLGISLKSIGEVRLAKKALIKAVRLNPRSPAALVHLGYLYTEGEGDVGQSNRSKALQLFRQASQLGDPFASIALLDMKSQPSL